MKEHSELKGSSGHFAMSNRLAAIALIFEAAVLLALVGYWIYLQLTLSRSLNQAIRGTIIAGGIAITIVLIWIGWRICRRHEYRFSLRSMLVAIAVVATLLAILVPKLQNSIAWEKKVAAYKRAQLVIQTHNGQQGGSQPSGTEIKLRPTLEDVLTPKEGYLRYVSFAGKALTEDDLSIIAEHPNLQGIEFSNCTFPEAAFLQLAKLKGAFFVDLRGQQMDEDWLRKLQGLRPDVQFIR